MPPMLPPDPTLCGEGCAGTRLTVRADDTLAVIQQRQDEYQAELEPLLGHYRDQGTVVDVKITGGVAVMERVFAEALGVQLPPPPPPVGTVL